MQKLLTTRRSFIYKFFASLSGGIALSSSAGKLFARPQQAPNAVSIRSDSQGYRETDHIRSYYNSVRD